MGWLMSFISRRDFYEKTSRRDPKTNDLLRKRHTQNGFWAVWRLRFGDGTVCHVPEAAKHTPSKSTRSPHPVLKVRWSFWVYARLNLTECATFNNSSSFSSFVFFFVVFSFVVFHVFFLFFSVFSTVFLFFFLLFFSFVFPFFFSFLFFCFFSSLLSFQQTRRREDRRTKNGCQPRREGRRPTQPGRGTPKQQGGRGGGPQRTRGEGPPNQQGRGDCPTKNRRGG